MKKSILLISCFLLLTNLYSQSCLPEGISFSSQEQIDNFQTNYPACTEIEGEVQIFGDDIVNLDGLNIITTIGGSLRLGNENTGCPNLQNLSGLSQLHTIDGDLYIITCNTLTNLNGLENLTHINGGELTIRDNVYLENFSGLENLNSALSISLEFNWSLISLAGLEGLSTLHSLDLYHNPSLINLQGLNNVTIINGVLRIEDQGSLVSFSGLNNLSSIDGSLIIAVNSALEEITSLMNLDNMNGILVVYNNNDLTSLSGLDNLPANSISQLNINDNASLSDCSVQSVCDYLADPHGYINIYNNAGACKNAPEIANSCGTQLSCLPNGNYFFSDQSEIDDFNNHYSGCIELNGRVIIRGDDIVNLQGLNQVNLIDGFFYIFGNHSLESLNGLNGLTSITHDFCIGGWSMWPYSPDGNDILNDISALENLNEIGGELMIKNNYSLSECDVEFVCEYLNGPSSPDIQNNDIGCNSVAVVEEACLVNLDEISVGNRILIYPNPADELIYIESELFMETICVYNHLGQRVKEIENRNNSIDISTLSPGFYTLELNNEDHFYRKTFIIQ